MNITRKVSLWILNVFEFEKNVHESNRFFEMKLLEIEKKSEQALKDLNQANERKDVSSFQR